MVQGKTRDIRLTKKRFQAEQAFFTEFVGREIEGGQSREEGAAQNSANRTKGRSTKFIAV
jgi:hypothetical protein